jgi:hypothetical protein
MCDNERDKQCVARVFRPCKKSQNQDLYDERMIRIVIMNRIKSLSCQSNHPVNTSTGLSTGPDSDNGKKWIINNKAACADPRVKNAFLASRYR